MKCKVTINNSGFFKKVFKKIVALGFLLFLVGIVTPAAAQMFSVGESDPQYGQPMSEIYLGLEVMDMNYKGASASEVGPEAGAFEFSGPILRAGYDVPGIDFFLGAGGEITGIDDAAYFDVGANIDFGLNLYRSEKLRLQIPFRIASRYTNVTNNQTQIFTSISRFQFGSLAAGAGAQILGRPVEDVRIEVGAVPAYGFSFASGGFFGGSIGILNVRGKLYFDRLVGDKGLSVGYKYDYRNYDVDEDVYDYSMLGHTIELGITF